MKRIIFLMLCMMILLVPQVSAPLVPTSVSCLDETRLTINYTYYIDNVPGNLSQIVQCSFGCSRDENICSPSPFNRNLSMVGIIVFIVIVTMVVFAVARK
jgi:hypothetical protein